MQRCMTIFRLILIYLVTRVSVSVSGYLQSCPRWNYIVLKISRLAVRQIFLSRNSPSMFLLMHVFICPIAIALHETDYKTGLHMSVCPSVRTLTVAFISSSIFAKIATDVKTTKSKNKIVGVNIAPPFPYFVPKTPSRNCEPHNHPVTSASSARFP